MLPKPQRLNLKKDFKWAASGRRYETDYFTLFFKKGDNVNPRIGIAVSSKFFKKAVDRNRARRLTSKVFENLYHKLEDGLNIVALPKSSVLGVKSDDLKKDIEKALTQ